MIWAELHKLSEIDILRMSRIYEVSDPIPKWVEDNAAELRLRIVEACEEAISEYQEVAEVVILKTKKGVTRFVLNGRSKAIEALRMTMARCVELEEYEVAARARDCIHSWEKLEKICQNQSVVA